LSLCWGFLFIFIALYEIEKGKRKGKKTVDDKVTYFIGIIFAEMLICISVYVWVSMIVV
jgi:hypothetical protein